MLARRRREIFWGPDPEAGGEGSVIFKKFIKKNRFVELKFFVKKIIKKNTNRRFFIKKIPLRGFFIKKS